MNKIRPLAALQEGKQLKLGFSPLKAAASIYSKYSQRTELLSNKVPPLTPRYRTVLLRCQILRDTLCFRLFPIQCSLGLPLSTKGLQQVHTMCRMYALGKEKSIVPLMLQKKQPCAQASFQHPSFCIFLQLLHQNTKPLIFPSSFVQSPSSFPKLCDLIHYKDLIRFTLLIQLVMQLIN